MSHLRVLMIERDTLVADAMARTINHFAGRRWEDVEVFHAHTILAARMYCEATPDLNGIILNGTLDGGTKHGQSHEEPDIEIAEFVRSIRERRPHVVMVAASNDAVCRFALMVCGCSIECTKIEAPAMLLQALDDARSSRTLS